MKFNEFSNEPLSEGILDVFRKKAPKQNEEITSEDLEFIKQYFPSAYGLKQYSAAEADLNIWHKGKGVDIAFLKRNGKLYASVSHLTSDGKRTVVSSLHDVSTPDKMKLLSQESYKELGFVDHKEIDEGWKHWVGGAALAGALGAGIAATPVAYVDGVRYDRAVGAAPADAKVVTVDGKKVQIWKSKPLRSVQGHEDYLYAPVNEEVVDEEIIDEWSRTDSEIQDILEKKGYQLLGKGVDQSAYLEPGTGNVLKIFGTQDTGYSSTGAASHTRDHEMFFEWAKFCMEHSNNPFLPKFDGFESFIFKDHTYLQIRQERLTDVPSQVGWDVEMTGDALEELVRKTGSSKKTNSLSAEIKRHSTGDSFLIESIKNLETLLGPENFEKFLRTVGALIEISRTYGYIWDLHENNVMMRGNTPVIVDPWVVPRY